MPGQPSRDPLTEQIIGAAIEVHRALGPGLLESTYEQCLAWELEQRGADVRRQVALPSSTRTSVSLMDIGSTCSSMTLSSK